MGRISRYVYLAAAWLFVIGVIFQVFLAGMAVVALQMSWVDHRALGHMLSFPLVVMVITLYLGRLPTPTKRMTWLLFATYILQADIVIFLRLQAPVVSALHPVLALADFALGIALAWRAWPLARQALAPAKILPDLKPSTNI